MGLTDFAKGIGEAVGGVASDVKDIGEDIVGAGVNVAKAGAWAATHVDEAAAGVANYGADAVKGVGWLATNPQYWDEAAKTMIKDQFTDPVNIATNVALLAATVATGGAAAPAWMAKLGMGAKGITEAATATKAVTGVAQTAKAASEVASVGRVGRFANAAREVGTGIKEAQGLQKVGAVLDAPTALVRAGRTNLAGINELGYIQRGRTALADKLIPSVGDATQSANWAQRAAYRSVAGGPGLAAEGAQTVGSNVMTRVNQLKRPAQMRENIGTFADVTQAIAHPERAAQELGQAAWNQYGDDVMAYGAKKIPGLIGKALTGGGEDKAAPEPYEPYQPDTTQAIGLQQFRLDQTRSTRTSRRQPGTSSQLGTVTHDTTMPSQVGPNDWYGPQGAYTAGRGFKQPLPPLQQPQALGV